MSGFSSSGGLLSRSKTSENTQRQHKQRSGRDESGTEVACHV